MSQPTADVILAGAEDEFADLEPLAAAGLTVSRCGSLIGALTQLERGGSAVVVVSGAGIADREQAAIAALRESGARGIVAVYPPTLTHRAHRADEAGADATLTLPAYPGALARAVGRLLGRRIDVESSAVAAPARGETRRPPSPRMSAGPTPTRAVGRSTPSEPGRSPPAEPGRSPPTERSAPSSVSTPSAPRPDPSASRAAVPITTPVETAIAELVEELTPTAAPTPEREPQAAAPTPRPEPISRLPALEPDPEPETIEPETIEMVRHAPAPVAEPTPQAEQAEEPLAEEVPSAEAAEPEAPTAEEPAADDADAADDSAPYHYEGTPEGGQPLLEALVADIALIQRAVTDLDRVQHLVLRSFQRRSQATRCSLMLRDTARDELYIRKAVGLPGSSSWPPVRIGDGLCGEVARTGRALRVEDVSALELGSEVASHLQRQGAYRTRSFLILPLRAAEGIQGVVCLADKRNGEAFTERDERALSFLAHHAAQAIENALKLHHLQDLAVIDELTGLYNRRHLQAALEREVQRAQRYQRPMTFALFDIDHFKTYNDTCGHVAGDRALAKVGELLRTSLREVDIVARYGGEEFAVILPETSATPGGAQSSPFRFLERLRAVVEQTPFPGEDKLPGGRLTLSGGIACFPADADNVTDLIRAADAAMYRSKDAGRNRITYGEERVRA